MTNTRIAYGDEFISATLPERTQILKSPSPLLPLDNPGQAIRDALYSPIAHDQISKLVGPKSKVTIVFDDPVIPQVPMKKPDFREMAIAI
ncbi:MAG: lactate racemase domain-containing protein, partial [Thermodesulfobacteriota bacterium]